MNGKQTPGTGILRRVVGLVRIKIAMNKIEQLPIVRFLLNHAHCVSVSHVSILALGIVEQIVI